MNVINREREKHIQVQLKDTRHFPATYKRCWHGLEQDHSSLAQHQ